MTVRSLARSVAAPVARRALRIASAVVPKDGSAVFASFPDFEDSTRVMLPALLKAHPRTTVITGGPPSPPSWAPAGVDVMARRSPSALLRYLRASVVYTTHGLYGMPPPVRGQLIVNLWHGMPIKRIDRAIGGKPWPFSFSLATSDFFADVLAASFEVERSDLVVTGLPRNDLLSDEGLPDGDRLHAELGGRYLVMLPTYRVTEVGLARRDGTDAVFQLDGEARAALDDVLRRHDLRLLVKPHPASPAGTFDSWTSERVVVVDDAWLRSREVTLYGVLARAEALITDYSSVSVDYLATGRSCILFQPDLDRYESDRGLATAPDVVATIGPRVPDIPSLVREIGAQASGGFRRDDSVHDHLWSVPTTGATARVLDEVVRRQRGTSTIQRPR